MGAFNFERTSFEGVYLINSFVTEDHRGYFVKDFEKEIYKQRGLDIEVFESFESYSVKNVIRGLHFQTNYPQAKLVKVVIGEIYDVIVDLRLSSSTFGKWEGFTLSSDNKKTLYIPEGFAHGFCVRSEYSIVSYKCIGKYQKNSDSGLIWNDSDLLIDWEIKDPIISDRDRSLLTFKDFVIKFGSL